MTATDPPDPPEQAQRLLLVQPAWNPAVTLLDKASPVVADEIRRVLLLASAQEAALLDIVNRPLQASRSEIMASSLSYLGVHAADGALCGWISLDREKREAGNVAVGSLVVDPARQRCGIGRMLLGVALKSVAPASLLVATPVLNTPALALYRSLGFVEFGRARSGCAAIELVLLHHTDRSGMP